VLSLAISMCHALSFIVGVAFVWSAVFLKESEEGKIQRTIDIWRVRMSRWPTHTGTRRAKLLTDSSLVATRVFDEIFGLRLLSFKSFIASVALSVGAAFVSFGEPEICCVGGLLFVTTLLPLVSRKFTHVVFVTFPALLTVLCLLEPEEFTALLLITGLAGLIGGISTLVFISVTRRVLKWAVASSSFAAAVALLVSNVIVTAVTVGVPLFGMRMVAFFSMRHHHGLMFIEEIYWMLLTRIVLLGTGVAALAAALVFLVAAVIVADTIFWFVLERQVYAAARYGLIKRKKSLLAVGAAFISWSLAPVGAWFQHLLVTIVK